MLTLNLKQNKHSNTEIQGNYESYNYSCHNLLVNRLRNYENGDMRNLQFLQIQSALLASHNAQA